MKINNPHDRFVKAALGKIEVAQSFLMNYLPENIRDMADISSFELQKDRLKIELH